MAVKDKVNKKTAKKFLSSLLIIMAISLGVNQCSSLINPNHDHTIEQDQDETNSIDHNHDHNHQQNTENNNQDVDNPTIDDSNNNSQDDNQKPIDGNNNTSEDNNKEDDDKIHEDFQIPNIGSYDGNSIVDALAQAGYDHSFQYRTLLAEYFNIKNYKGTTEQNIELLNYLKEYAKQHQIEHNHNFSQWEALNNIYEIKTCNGCGATETRAHTYTKTLHNYTANEENHTITEITNCNTCAHTLTKIYVEDHNYGNWIDNGNDEETRTCSDCGYVETREIEKPHKHTYSAWTFFDENLEKRTCECGAVQTQYHSYSLLYTNYLDVNEHQHEIHLTYECTSCDNIKTLKLTTNHTFSNWQSFNDDKEIRTCTKDGRVEYRAHSYSNWHNNGDGTETRICSTCDHSITRDIAHTHNYGEWTSLNDTQEVRTCECGEKEYRSHNYSATPSKEEYTNNQDGTHTLTKTYECSTCDHDKKISETQNHEYGVEATEQRYVTNNNGTHEVYETYECICGDRTEKLVTQNETCEYGSWVVSADGKTQTKTCTNCGHEVTEELVHTHSLGETALRTEIETNSNGTHDIYEVFECTSCHEEIKVLKEANVTCEYEWSYKDDQTEVGICECGHTKERTHTLPNEWTYNPTTGKDERICSTCNHKFEREHEHSLSETILRTEIETNSNGTHDIYEVFECTSCHEEIKVLKEANVTCEYEWSYKDDQTEVGICECGEKEYRSHNYSATPSKEEYTNNQDGTHTLTKTYECSTCDHDKKISETQNHEYGVEATEQRYVTNNNGTHEVYETYECICGDRTEKLVTQNETCEYGSWVVSADGKTQTKTCTNCGHEVTEELVHTHSLGETALRTEIETNSNGTHDIYEVFECTSCHEEIKVLKEANVTCEYEWSYKDDQTEVGICECGHTKERTHTLPNEWTYNPTTGKDERICSTCNHKFEREHEHSLSETILRTEIETNSNGTHDIYEVFECTSCHEEIKVLKEANVTCEYEWSYKDDQTEVGICECGHTKERTHTLPNEWTYNPTTGKDERICSTCNHKFEREHEHSLSETILRTEIETNSNGTHDIYEVFECTSCHEEIKVLKEANVTCEYEWSYKDDQTEVGICECGHTKERTHTLPNEWTYNPTTGKDERICSTCNHKFEREHEHSLSETILRTEIETNSNGTHDIYEVFECTSCHEEIKVLKEANVTCEYEWSYKDDQTEVGICECGHTKERTHTLPNEWTYNPTTGKDERICSTCNHKFEREHEHSLSETILRTEIETNSNGTHDIYEVFECTSCHEEIKVLKEANVTCEYEWSYKDDQTEVGICECGHTKERTHTLPNEWTYNPTTGKDERICSTCNHKFEREHEHSLSETILRTEIETNSNGTHDIYEVFECTSCHEEIKVLKEANVTCEYTNRYDYINNDAEKAYCECGHEKTQGHNLNGEWTYNTSTGMDEQVCGNCNHTITREHEHIYSDESTRIEPVEGNDTQHYIITEKTCTSCGQTQEVTRELVNHAYGEWTYDAEKQTEIRICSDCGNVESRTHEHTYDGWTSMNDEGATKKCVTSGCNHEVTHSHTYGTPIVNDEGALIYTCTDENCKHEKIVAHEHDYTAGLTWSTEDPNDEYCTKITYTCDCGDTYDEGVSKHTWEEDWLDPSLEQCTGCGIFRTKATTLGNEPTNQSETLAYKKEDDETAMTLTLKR